ncbi:flavin monoamine oxidase family protein [Winogradskyella sp. PE311]|uniref:flavin monoamine oxidase family protein n=1 Tax=Winogradskyella sp. PE311 TaxID=3366943 RepID=UPI0039806E84
MKTINTDVLIIGAGLTGLALGYYLRMLNISVTIVEARSHIGGRINTKYNKNQAPIELGATWIIKDQTNTFALLKELKIPVFEQYYGETAIYQPNQTQAAQLVKLPTNNSVSYRVSNGTFSIIDKLYDSLKENVVKCDQNIQSINLLNDTLVAITNDTSYECKHIVSTIPPLLFSKSIKVNPTLPHQINNVLLNTHTWMHNSIRIGFTYKNPFWRSERTSGTIYSSAGIIQEFYDHSDKSNNLYALSGFINGASFKHTKEERKKLALDQLAKYYGDMALNYESYEECVWVNEKYTSAVSEQFLMPQANNGHSLFLKTYLNNKLFIAGAETSSIYSGKMEGAITSAKIVFQKLKTIYN